MRNYEKLLQKWTKKREEIHEKMRPHKEALKPLSKKLFKANNRIANIKSSIKKEQNTCNKKI